MKKESFCSSCAQNSAEPIPKLPYVLEDLDAPGPSQDLLGHVPRANGDKRNAGVRSALRVERVVANEYRLLLPHAELRHQLEIGRWGRLGLAVRVATFQGVHEAER